MTMGSLVLAGCGTATIPVSETLPASEVATAVTDSGQASPLPTATAAETGEGLSPIATPVENPTDPPQLVLPTVVPQATTDPAARRANADVLFVKAVQMADDTWTFEVTVEHQDIGWEDYADGWDVVTPEGEVLKPDPSSPFTRLLLHPHENEQPFTRSQSGIVIPPGLTQVLVRAHDLVDGYGGQEVIVDLTQPSGEGFEVQLNR
jgi:hypothetical protein